MKKFNSRSGFTLVEIMIVVMIIALLVAMVIPRLLHERLSANDTTAKVTLQVISAAAESFRTDRKDVYPSDIYALTSTTPPYLNANYCNGAAIAGFVYNCSMSTTGYTVTATPVKVGSTGSTTYTITTGGVLTPS